MSEESKIVKEKLSLGIVSIEELLKLNLAIPNYQRPYRWTTKSALTLFNDIYSAYKDHLQEYRIGTVILFNKNYETNYEIVDGQQRITTILILLYCLEEESNKLKNNTNGKNINLDYAKLFDISYSNLSYISIVENYQVLSRKCKEISNELDSFEKYLLDNCKFVKIVTKDLKEAFQFFDSQNSRGKDLAPHDLLKAYHLREMNYEKEKEKIEIIEKWENINQKGLEDFFYYCLYPLIKWYKNRSGLYYSKKDIDNFKGIKQNSDYNYSIYHKAATLYIEKFNKDCIYELINGKQISPYQLTQPIISGKRFFDYSIYYFKLSNKIENIIKKHFNNPEKQLLINGKTGDKYVYRLFLNVIIFFVDKFGLEELKESRLVLFYKWCYSLRLEMQAVYQETINNYALGEGRINNGINMFSIIAEIQNPIDLDGISFEDLTNFSNNVQEI